MTTGVPGDCDQIAFGATCSGTMPLAVPSNEIARKRGSFGSWKNRYALVPLVRGPSDTAIRGWVACVGDAVAGGGVDARGVGDALRAAGVAVLVAIDGVGAHASTADTSTAESRSRSRIRTSSRLDERRAERLLQLAERMVVRFEVERRDALAYDLDRVTEVTRVSRGVEDADVGAVADEAKRIHALLAQRDVEVGPEEAGVAPLRDHHIASGRCELRDDLRALRSVDRVRREHLELGVVAEMVVGEIDDDLPVFTRARELALDDVDDRGHGRAAIKGAGRIREVVDHIHDDEGARRHLVSGARREFFLVRAGLGGAGLIRGLERLAAAAARHGVRVAKREPTAHERVHEVDLGALDVHRAHQIHDDANAVLLDERVVLFAALREGHAVRETAAPTRGHVDAK